MYVNIKHMYGAASQQLSTVSTGCSSSGAVSAIRLRKMELFRIYLFLFYLQSQ